MPNGLPRSCCDASKQEELTPSQQELYTKLRRIVGKDNILEGGEENTHTTKFLKGARLGHGKALAIVVGIGFIGFQTAVSTGYLAVDWTKISDDLKKKAEGEDE